MLYSFSRLNFREDDRWFPFFNTKSRNFAIERMDVQKLFWLICVHTLYVANVWPVGNDRFVKSVCADQISSTAGDLHGGHFLLVTVWDNFYQFFWLIVIVFSV